jgi:hypothetical protein
MYNFSSYLTGNTLRLSANASVRNQPLFVAVILYVKLRGTFRTSGLQGVIVCSSSD